ncbi:hypothetical protein C8J56DRAFT_1053703 [Mycena floridula]|nr:hypothetical protein C8J56DRAFT_1058953 [Mycena floridula]KAJ7585321.1 hypothetical protein C8J56DRAFT_1053703 [Mycena floridula]
MKFSAAVAFAISFFAGTVVAQDVGQPCPADQAGAVGCANTPSVNNGNAYIFICNGQEFVLFADCASPFGCQTEGPFNASSRIEYVDLQYGGRAVDPTLLQRYPNVVEFHVNLRDLLSFSQALITFERLRILHCSGNCLEFFINSPVLKEPHFMGFVGVGIAPFIGSIFTLQRFQSTDLRVVKLMINQALGEQLIEHYHTTSRL